MSEIQRLQEMFRSQTDPQVVKSLRETITSAAKLVTAASSLVSSRSAGSAGRGSEIQEDWSEQLRRRIENWIPSIEEETQPSSAFGTAVVSETNITSLSEEMERPRDVLQYDLQKELIQSWRKSALLYYESQQYNEAKGFLEKLLKKSTAKYGKAFEGRDDILRMLATCYCWLEDWKSAEGMLHSEFDGRWKAVELLAMCYLQCNKWDEAEKVLLQVDTEEEVQLQAWKMHALAEVSMAKGEFEIAISWCNKAIDLRTATIGSKHVLFFMSINLLAQIYEAQGDIVEATGYSDLLPPGIQGTSGKSVIDQECLDIEKLRFMRPDKAASAVEGVFSHTFASLPVNWDEIRDNIRKSGRGSVGSGYGYTLLHAFVQQGNDLAVRFLIEKGTDINAKTNKGATALHFAIKHRNEALVRLLMEYGADISATDALGRTPLIIAARTGSDHIVGLLLDMNADPEAKDNNGETALMVAAKNGLEIMVRRLLDAGADGVSNYPHGGTPRDLAAQRGFLEVARLLHGAGNHKKRWYRRVLHNDNDEYKRQVRLAKTKEKEKERARMSEDKERDRKYQERADKVGVDIFSATRLTRLV